MKKVFKRADQIFFILMILFVSILMQIFFIPRLPNKYFYDSTGILSIVIFLILQLFLNGHIF